MVNMKIFKRVLAGSMIFVMGLGLMTGCEKDKEKKSEVVYTVEEASKEKALKIGDYEICMDELMVYAIQEIVTYNVTSDQIKKDEEKYKEQTLSLLRETKILYDVAKHNDVELVDSDIEQKDKMVDAFKSKVPQDIRDKWGISDEVIDKVFTERTYVEKFTNDIKNNMGKDIQDSLTEAYKDYNFVNIYYMMFPTVEVNDDYEPATATDGSYIELSDEDKSKVLDSVNSAIKDIKSGKDYIEVAKTYGVDKYSSEQSGYVGGYSDEVNSELENMKAGDCSNVIESKLGYTVIYMIKDHDEELKTNYVFAITEDTLNDNYNALYNDWLASITIDPEEDIIGDAWLEFDMASMSDDLFDAKVVSGK